MGPQRLNNTRGFIVLISLLIAGGIAVAIGIMFLLLGTQEVQTGLRLQQSIQARSLADTCAQEALMQIRDSSVFIGSGSIVLGQGSCSYTVTDTGGATRRIESTATVSNIVYKVRVDISSIVPNIVISSWQNVSDF